VLCAKLSLGALAFNNKWFGGETKNPWNLKTGSSGSSAGSTAATVAGLVPFAIGTETFGSIISPSSVCGATGLRPSFGSVSRTGAMTLCWSLDRIGPICRSAEDAAFVFNFIHGTDNKDRCAVNFPFNYKNAIEINKLKIGYTKKDFDALDSNSTEWKVLDVFRQLGANLIPIDFPDSNIIKVNPWIVTQIVIDAESAAAFDAFTRNNIDDEMTSQTRNDWPNTFRTSRFISAVDYINANRHRYWLMQEVNKVMSQFDAIISPTWSPQFPVANLAGYPVLCIPTGFTKDNLPTSITLIGKLYDEATLLEMGKQYQDATQWNKIHPEMFK